MTPLDLFPSDDRRQVVRYRTADGCKTGIALRGRTRIKIVMILDRGVAVESVPITEERYMAELSDPLPRALKAFRKAGKRRGITKAAKRLLRN